eukprot:13043243-Alexandrium_andersonii.AAC.1
MARVLNEVRRSIQRYLQMRLLWGTTDVMTALVWGGTHVATNQWARSAQPVRGRMNTQCLSDA